MTTTNGPRPQKLDEFIALPELAKLMGVSKGVVARWRRDLGLPSIRVGSRIYFREAAVAAWLGAQEQVAPREEPPAPAPTVPQEG